MPRPPQTAQDMLNVAMSHSYVPFTECFIGAGIPATRDSAGQATELIN